MAKKFVDLSVEDAAMCPDLVRNRVLYWVARDNRHRSSPCLYKEEFAQNNTAWWAREFGIYIPMLLVDDEDG